MLLEDAQGPEALLRLCAATDRGMRCTSAERARIASLVRDMEADAPPADATMLNGNWRLLYASTPSVYRSSPFFWAFKQATLTLSLSLSLSLTLAPPGRVEPQGHPPHGAALGGSTGGGAAGTEEAEGSAGEGGGVL